MKKMWGDFALLFIIKAVSAGHNCLGAPFIYATFHEGAFVYKFSRDGCLLSTNVLVGTNKEAEFRSMAIGAYETEVSLYLTDALSSNSKVLVYGNCDSNGNRHYVATPVECKISSGLNHLYGICFDNLHNLYVTNQHTDSVVRFYKNSFKPMPLPLSISHLENSDRNYYKGTFVQFGDPGIHNSDEQGIRSIILVHNEFWIANEDISGILIVNARTGVSTNIITMESPIGLHFDSTHNLVFATGKGKHRSGQVHAINPKTLRVVRTYLMSEMSHPTGVVSYEDKLFVAEQALACILSFDIRSGAYLGKVVEHLHKDIEQIILSSC